MLIDYATDALAGQKHVTLTDYISPRYSWLGEEILHEGLAALTWPDEKDVGCSHEGRRWKMRSTETWAWHLWGMTAHPPYPLHALTYQW